jgi:16S rRNA (cytosine967-C5)-methyltransferase
MSHEPPRTARELAVQAILAAEAGERYVADMLAEARGTMDSRDAGLAREIALGVTRHAVTLNHILRRVADYDPLHTHSSLRAILSAAAFEAVWLDRVPLFAAVNEAVDLARAMRGRAAAGMVNAILRRLAGAITERRAVWTPGDARRVRVSWSEACVFSHEVLPAPDAQPAYSHIAAATGESTQRFATWVSRYGEQSAEQIAWASQAVPPIVLQRNALRLSAAEFESSLREYFGDDADVTGEAAFLPPSARLTELPAFSRGAAFAQDATAHAAAAAVQAMPGERILDLCAAPGGKSIALAIAMRDQGEVVACDDDARRLERVGENAARLGLSCIRSRVIRGVDARQDGLGLFDAVLVDAPCSNSGVLARRPEARGRINDRNLAGLHSLQLGLLTQAAALVKPGGRLVYSTCSIEPAENEQVVAAFATAHDGWICEASELTLPAWGPRGADWRDGGFFARLRRGG